MAFAIWQPRRLARAGRRLEPVPWRRLAGPCVVTLFGGVVFYALIVELSFVLDDVGLTSSAAIGAVAALMSLATAIGAWSFARVARHPDRVLLSVAFGLSALGLMTVYATASVAVITVGAVLTGLGTGLLLPTLVTRRDRLVLDGTADPRLPRHRPVRQRRPRPHAAQHPQPSRPHRRERLVPRRHDHRPGAHPRRPARRERRTATARHLRAHRPR